MTNIKDTSHAEATALLKEAIRAHTSAQRVDTVSVVTRALQQGFPDYKLTTSPQCSTDLLGFAESGRAKATPFDKGDWVSSWTVKGAVRHASQVHYARMMGEEVPHERKKGGPELKEEISYGAFVYEWEGCEFLLFVVDGINCGIGRPDTTNYILRKEDANAEGEEPVTHKLMKKVAEWMMQIGDAVLVFDQGRWKKDGNLWQVTKTADWNKVVLSEDTKKSLRADVEGFFDSENLYKSFTMPWKRGTIFHGPPGNGKTLVIQTLMKSLTDRAEPIPTLYVKTFVAERGPQWSVAQIFSRARAVAPCLLVFEDIDSMVTEKLRSYFLNEVDGLESNDGIYMLGTTNHLDRLDPSLSQRPSRFDRKIPFTEPPKHERAMYAKSWKTKLFNISDAEFPESLCDDIAEATEGFSFAYLKELFVATFLGIAREGMNPTDLSGAGDASEEKILRPRIMAQVEVLKVAIADGAAKEREKEEKKKGIVRGAVKGAVDAVVDDSSDEN